MNFYKKSQHFVCLKRYISEGGQKGESEAVVEKLYRLYYDELTAWCTGMTQEAAAAEDLVQEAYLRALDSEKLLCGLTLNQCRAWLYRTVKNLYVDKFRRKRFETLTQDFPETAEGQPGYEEFENSEFLSCLPEEERTLFTMRYLEGYNSRELGNLFSMPAATVRMKLASARKHLKKEWEE